MCLYAFVLMIVQCARAFKVKLLLVADVHYSQIYVHTLTRAMILWTAFFSFFNICFT